MTTDTTMPNNASLTRSYYSIALIASSVWNAVLALTIFTTQGQTIRHSGHVHAESLFFMALALFHAIYAIWFWQGRHSRAFAHATAFGHALFGISSVALAIQLQHTGAPDMLPTAIALSWIDYLWINGLTEIISAVAIYRAVLLATSEPPPILATAYSTEEKNRFLFACYMSALALWLGAATNDFLDFFRLPATLFDGWPALSFGPVHLLPLLIALLAFYNVVAVKHHITSLIEAGMRGGLLTCVFFLLLVLAGLLHPLVLLIPAVDLFSVIMIFIRRVRAAK